MDNPIILLVSENANTLREWSCRLTNDYTIEVALGWQESKLFLENAGLHIDLTVLDGNLIPDDYLFSSLSENAPGKLVVIGHQWSEQKQIQLIASGASGYQDSQSDDTSLTLIVNRVLEGEVWIQRHLIPKIIKTLIANKIDPQKLHDDDEITAKKKELLKSLTPREMQVADMVFHGGSTKKIAATLFITERTVKAHLSAIFRKLEVPDRIHLAIYLRSISGTREEQEENLNSPVDTNAE